MENKLTDTQLFMIEQIKKAIAHEEELLKKAGDGEKPKHRIRMTQLHEQLEKASTPFERTEEEKELIEKIAKNVKENVEVSTGKKIEGDRADKPLTSKEEFEHGLSLFIEEVGRRKEELEKTLVVYENIYNKLADMKIEGDEKIVSEELKSRRNIIAQIKMSLELFNDRLAESAEVEKWALDNYDNISKLNKYLNNPLRLKDYEEYETALRKKYMEE